jgi:hypothetical protein
MNASLGALDTKARYLHIPDLDRNDCGLTQLFGLFVIRDCGSEQTREECSGGQWFRSGSELPVFTKTNLFPLLSSEQRP